MERFHSKCFSIGLLLALACLALMLSRNIKDPWIINNDYNGVVWSQAAHNFLRAGIVKTRAVPAAFYAGPLPIPSDGYYVHHPSFLPLVITALFFFLGEKEWVARILPIACSLLSVILLWLMMRKSWGRRAAAFSAWIFAITPMELHYGSMVNFEPCTLMWILAAILNVQYWQQTNRQGYWMGSIICFVLAMWMSWLGCFFVFAFSLWFFFGKRDQRLAIVLLLCAFVSILVFLLQVTAVEDSAWTDMLEASYFRIGIHDALFTWQTWFHQMYAFAFTLISPIAWLLALLGAIGLYRKKASLPRLENLYGSIALIFLVNLFYVLAFRNASFIHGYASFYFLAPVAMLGGIGVDLLLQGICSKPTNLRWTVGIFVVLGIFIELGRFGYVESRKLPEQLYVLDGTTPEPRMLIPALGKIISQSFSEDTEILCNFQSDYIVFLEYYSQKTFLCNLTSYGDWSSVAFSHEKPRGGVIWLDGPGADELLANLSQESQQLIHVEGLRFCLWKANRHWISGKS